MDLPEIQSETLDDALITIQGLRQVIGEAERGRRAAENSLYEARKELEDLRDLYRSMLRDYSRVFDRLSECEACM
jgi:hypothetical protein